MKKFDLIELINNELYKSNNLEKNMRGILLEFGEDFSKVLFFNSYNLGDYIVVQLKNNDFIKCKEEIPDNLKEELKTYLNRIISKSKEKFEPTYIKDYDIVELVVENERYSKFDIHKGDRGCVMDCKAIKNYIEVDFTKVNVNGEISGDCISVNLNDLKLVF